MKNAKESDPTDKMTKQLSEMKIDLNEDYIFYQTIDIPGIGLVTGSWDHTKSTDVYLGHTNFEEKTVLDVGPANGFFSFEMEKRGGKITALDLGQDSQWDAVHHQFIEEDELVESMRSNVKRVENAFWLAHEALDSNVKLVYGTVYEVPDKIESTQIALVSNVLQHFKDPLLAIQRVASVVTETLIITETIWHDDPAFLDSASIRLIPRFDTPEVSHSFYQVSPSFVMELLMILGFPFLKCEIHDQNFNSTSTDHEARMVKHFTVTASRVQPLEKKVHSMLEIGYSSGFGEVEGNKLRSWRSTYQKESTITVNNKSKHQLEVGLSFGIFSHSSNAKVEIEINETRKWQGDSFFGVRPVVIPDITLRPGANYVKILCRDDNPQETSSESEKPKLQIIEFSIISPHPSQDGCAGK